MAAPSSMNPISDTVISFIARRRACLFVLALPLLGCSSTPYIWAKDLPPHRASPAIESRAIGRGDVIAISVVGQAAISSTVAVGADGTITLPDAGVVNVAGQTVEQAQASIVRRLSSILQDPKVSVVVVTRFIEVSLLGEVTSPGKYLLQSGDGIANAIAVAGGFSDYANESSIFLVRASEPQRIRFKMKEVLRGGASAHSFALRDGDILVVE